MLWLIPLFAVFILPGSTEQLVLGGYMLQTGVLQMPGLAAILGTSLLFSAMHRDFDPIPFANIVLYALFACFVAMTGVNFGVEASLMGTAVLMVAWVVAVFNHRPPTKQRA